MLPIFTLFCVCFTVISAKPAYETLVEDIEHNKIIQKLQSIANIKAKFIQHSTVLQQQAATQSNGAYQTLSSLPRECSTDRIRDIKVERKNLLANYYKCSIFQLLEEFAELGYGSAKYAYNAYRDTSIIVADVIACVTTGFNPLNFIYCIFQAVKIIPNEIEDIIVLTKDFENSLDTLLPSIYQGLESCFGKTSSSYKIFLDDVLKKAKVCESSMNLN